MATTLSNKKAAFTSGCASAIVEAVRIWDPVSEFFDAIIKDWSPRLIANHAWVSRGILEFIFFSALFVFIFGLLKITPIGESLYGMWKPWENRGSNLLRRLWSKQVYTGGERASEKFHDHIRRSIERSKHIYCLLFAGFTMVHETEKFILDALKDVPTKELESKDLRFLLLDPDSPHWESRAKVFLESGGKRGGVTNLENYKSQCQSAREVLALLPGAKVTTYNQIPPLWRLHIFDDCVFVSRYSEPGDRDFKEGHLTAVVALTPKNPMYQWMYSAFRSRCPKDWKESLPFRLRTSDQDGDHKPS